MTTAEPQFAAIAALLGDPARANILRALMDGRARTAKELAAIAGVTAPTASGHLGKLMAAELLTVLAQGRHRYYRLANSLVACAIESLMALAGERPLPRHRHNAALTGALRCARTCYDHLVSASGRLLLARIDIDVDAVARQRRGFARPCLDWSERVPHLAGGLGAAIASHCFDHGWITRQEGSRAVRLTDAGAKSLKSLFGIEAGDIAAGSR